MLINAADKVLVNKIIYWPKFLFLPSSKDHKSHNYWTHYFALILARTLIHFLEASLLIVIIRFSDVDLFPPFSGWWWDSRLWGIREDHDVTSVTKNAIYFHLPRDKFRWTINHIPRVADSSLRVNKMYQIYCWNLKKGNTCSSIEGNRLMCSVISFLYTCTCTWFKTKSFIATSWFIWKLLYMQILNWRHLCKCWCTILESAYSLVNFTELPR